MLRRLAISLLTISGLAGCEQLPPGLIGPVGGGSTSSLHGTVSNPTAKTRVGLLAQPNPGSPRVELQGTSAANGTFALSLLQPPVSMLEQPSEDKSFVFVLMTYEDTNANGRYDDGTDRLRTSASGGSYRWFAESGPSNASGWNVFKDGRYSQAVDVAVGI